MNVKWQLLSSKALDLVSGIGELCGKEFLCSWDRSIGFVLVNFDYHIESYMDEPIDATFRTTIFPITNCLAGVLMDVLTRTDLLRDFVLKIEEK